MIQSVSAGEAFMHVVRSTNERTANRPVAASLGVFSSDSKRACAERLSRLLDSDRPLREKMGHIALVTLLTAAVVLLPKLDSTVAAPPDAAPATTVRDQK